MLTGRVADILYLMNIVSGKLIANYAIDDCIIEIKNETATIKAANDGETMFMSISKKFERSENGTIVIGSIRRIHEILGKFDKNDEISIFENENKLVLQREHPLKKFTIDTVYSKLVKSIKLADRINFKDGITIKGNSGAEKKIAFSTHIEMQSAYIKDMLSDGLIVESVATEIKYNLTVNKGKFYINLHGDDGDIENELITDSVQGSDSASYGFIFAQIFNNIVGDVEIHYMTDSILHIKQKYNDLEINYLIK